MTDQKHRLMELSEATLTPGAWQWTCACRATGSAPGQGRARLQYVNHKVEDEEVTEVIDNGSIEYQIREVLIEFSDYWEDRQAEEIVKALGIRYQESRSEYGLGKEQHRSAKRRIVSDWEVTLDTRRGIGVGE